MPFTPPLTGIELSFIGRLLAAAVLGALMGLDRSIAGKHAGMRTYALVSLGSCAFTIVSTLASYQLGNFIGINPLQISASVVIGIGFIGSGLAVFGKEHPVELTTASGIWVVAAVGLAAGYGLYIIAVTTAFLGILIFSLFSRFEYWLRVRFGADGKK